MLKGTPQEEGCLYGCLPNILLGGTIGTVAAFLWAGSELPLLLRWAFAAVGFLAGIVLWTGARALIIRFLSKNEEDKL